MKRFVNLIRKEREFSIVLIDIISFSFAYILAFLFRFIDNPNSIFSYQDHFINILLTLPFGIIINFIFLYLFKVNKSLWKYTSLDEVARICISCLLTNIFWFFIVIFLPVRPYIRSVPVIGMVFEILIMLGVRFLYRFFHDKNIEKEKKYNALIIGAGSAGALLIHDIQSSEHSNFDVKVVGFLDDNVNLISKRIYGVEVLGTIKEINDIAPKYNVNIVYIAIPSASKKRISEIISLCSDLHIKTEIMDYQVRSNLEEVSKLREVSPEDLLGRDEIILNVNSIHSYLENKNVLVTGGGGSIGSELCRQILKYKPKSLVVLDIYENNMYALQQELLIKRRNNLLDTNTNIIFLIGSVRDKKRIDDVIENYKINVVFHAAAHKHVPLVEDSPNEAIKNNVFGTLNTIKSCIEHNVQKFILISTDKAVNPTNVMGCTKRLCELIIQSFKNNGITEVGAVRFGNVLGSNGSVIPLFKKQILAGGPVTVTDPNIERYFMTIPEASSLVVQAGAYAKNGDIFVLDMGTRVKILTLAENMIKLSGLTPYQDIDIDFVGLRPGEKMYEEISLGNEKRYKTENELIFVNESLQFDSGKFLKELDDLHKTIIEKEDFNVSEKLFSLVNEYK